MVKSSQTLKLVLVVDGRFGHCRIGITDRVKVALLCPLPKRLLEHSIIAPKLFSATGDRNQFLVEEQADFGTLLLLPRAVRPHEGQVGGERVVKSRSEVGGSSEFSHKSRYGSKRYSYLYRVTQNNLQNLQLT